MKSWRVWVRDARTSLCERKVSFAFLEWEWIGVGRLRGGGLISGVQLREGHGGADLRLHLEEGILFVC